MPDSDFRICNLRTSLTVAERREPVVRVAARVENQI
jgi:hypothetical protein